MKKFKPHNAKRREDQHKQRINKLKAKITEENQQNDSRNRDSMEQLEILGRERDKIQKQLESEQRKVERLEQQKEAYQKKCSNLKLQMKRKTKSLAKPGNCSSRGDG